MRQRVWELGVSWINLIDFFSLPNMAFAPRSACFQFEMYNSAVGVSVTFVLSASCKILVGFHAN